jgi:hypothetical protein
VAVDLQDPRQIARDLVGNCAQAVGQLAQLVPAARLDVGRAGREQDLGLEHEAVADHPHVGALAEQLPQPAEELGAEAAQLLDLAGERDAQLAAQVGDRDLLSTLAVRDRAPAERQLDPEALICRLRMSTWFSASRDARLASASSERPARGASSSMRGALSKSRCASIALVLAGQLGFQRGAVADLTES